MNHIFINHKNFKNLLDDGNGDDFSSIKICLSIKHGVTCILFYYITKNKISLNTDVARFSPRYKGLQFIYYQNNSNYMPKGLSVHAHSLLIYFVILKKID